MLCVSLVKKLLNFIVLVYNVCCFMNKLVCWLDCVIELLGCSSSHTGYCRCVCSICFFDILCCWCNFVPLCFLGQHSYFVFNMRCQEYITLPALHVSDFTANMAIWCSFHELGSQNCSIDQLVARNYFLYTKFAQFVNWAKLPLPNSGNRQAVCPVHALGIGTAHFTNWAMRLPSSRNGQFHRLGVTPTHIGCLV